MNVDDYVRRLHDFRVNLTLHYGRIADDAHFRDITESLIERMRTADGKDFAESENALLLYAKLISEEEGFREVELTTPNGMFPNYDFNPVSYVKHSHKLLLDNAAEF